MSLHSHKGLRHLFSETLQYVATLYCSFTFSVLLVKFAAKSKSLLTLAYLGFLAPKLHVEIMFIAK